MPLTPETAARCCVQYLLRRSNALPSLGIVFFLLLSPAFSARADVLMVPMTDGVRLAADLFLPSEGGPAFPVVLVRTVYGRDGGLQLAKPYLDLGIAFLVQDTRGRNGSEGELDRCFEADGWGQHRDGYDTVEWIRRQPWCNGKVGTLGTSALGTTQVLLAATGAAVDAQSIVMAPSRFYGQLGYQGGVLQKKIIETWNESQGGDYILRLYRAHPCYDGFWRDIDAEARVAQVKAPGLHVSGWFDVFALGAVQNFLARQHRGGEGARGAQKLIIGPWPHGSGRKVGELEYPENSVFDISAYERRYFCHWLMGKDNGISDEPAVRYYTMGACGEPGAPGNEWRATEDWPPPAAQPAVYFLSAEGMLVNDAGAVLAGRRTYTFDPTNPCPTHGGANAHLPMGPMDQRVVSNRSDVLKFETAPLTAPVEATGPVKVRLYISTDAPDTDFTAKLVDIYPDGREMLLLDNVQRLKFCGGYAEPKLLPPGEVGVLEIDLWHISQVFNTGHKIGVQISSSNYPRFELNPNTGANFPAYTKAMGSEEAQVDPLSVRTARNTVHMDRQRPSALLLSVIPSDAGEY